jgi:hypothetical protein
MAISGTAFDDGMARSIAESLPCGSQRPISNRRMRELKNAINSIRPESAMTNNQIHTISRQSAISEQ